MIHHGHAPILRRTVYRKGHVAPWSVGLAPYTGRMTRCSIAPGVGGLARAGWRPSRPRLRGRDWRAANRPPVAAAAPRRRGASSGGCPDAVAAAAALLAAAWLRLRRALTMNRAVALALCALFVAGPRGAAAPGRAAPERRVLLLRVPALHRQRPRRQPRQRLRLIGIGGDAIMDADRPRATPRRPGRWARPSLGRRSMPSAMLAPRYLVGPRRAGGHRRVVVSRTGRPSASPACSTACSVSGSATALPRGSSPSASPRWSTAALAFGSFMLWYIVKEPTMSHATSMCAVAAFIYAWAVTRGRRAAGQWAALGLLGGLMLAVRWQNLVFLAFPAWEFDRRSPPVPAPPGTAHLGAARRAVRAPARRGVPAAALAWNAIYGSPLAVSPLSPKMLWLSPDLVRMLWSSRNGLFATSPITYLAALGLVVFAVRDRAVRPARARGLRPGRLRERVGRGLVGRRGVRPAAVRRHDAAAGGGPRGGHRRTASLDGEAAAGRGRRPPGAARARGTSRPWPPRSRAGFGGSVPQSFAESPSDQARTLHRWFGHPFSYPANLSTRHAGRRAVPVGLFAFAVARRSRNARTAAWTSGCDDDAYLGDGWHQADTQPDGTTARWRGPRPRCCCRWTTPAPLILQLA